MRYMIEIAPRKAAGTYQGNKLEAENLKEVFAKIQAYAVQPIHIAKYLGTRGPTSQFRANREISLLSTIFSYGMRWDAANRNPCIGVTKNKEKGRDRYIQDSEFEWFKSIAGELIATVMDFAYITALRKGDILSMKLEQITDEGNMGKTEQNRRQAAL